MTNTKLDELWNRLRNAAFGRSIAPLVSPQLADEVQRHYEVWKTIRNSTWGQGELQKWVNHYNRLRRLVIQARKANGNPVKPEEGLDQAGRATPLPERMIPDLPLPNTRTIRDFALTVGAGVAVAVIVSLFTQRR